MNTVIFSVRSNEDITRDVLRFAEGDADAKPRISFDTHERMVSLLSGKRWEILRVMSGAGPLSIREIARRVGRDIKAVHGDVTALAASGVIDRAGARVVFPYDRIHVDYVLDAAA